MNFYPLVKIQVLHEKYSIKFYVCSLIWMKEFLRYSIDEVVALYMSRKIILHYVSKCLNSGEVKAETLGRPFNSFLMHPHMEFVIEAVLDHP